ncbi:MAG: endolytic transglycosylase MltG [Patescibacteria group bacterium]
MIKRLIFSLLVGAVGLIALGVWMRTSLQPINSGDKATKIFVINPGDGVKEISRKLKTENLIRDQVAFFILVKIENLERKIQAGDFRLSPSMPAQIIAESLTHGTLDNWITIPEGWRSEEILEYLKMSGDWKKDEGKLFPDTYLIPKNATASDIRKIMLANYERKTTDLQMTDQVLIIASLIEREARTEEDRPLVASVIYNRLEANMALDIDATVQYALGSWKKDLTLEDLKIKSPYNTYLNSGLPPGPISNPGLSAITAALNPAKTDYYFYISDKTGKMHFSQTLSEHNANVIKYLQ